MAHPLARARRVAPMLFTMQEHRAAATTEAEMADRRDAYEAPRLERQSDWEIVTGSDTSALP